MRTGSVPYFLCRARLYQRLKTTTDIQNKYLVMYRHYKIFCVNRNTGFRKESRIFYFIHLQNEEDYERKKSSSA